MPLPKLKHPLYEFVIPSTKKKLKFRPFLVKEEKLLLMAKETADVAESLRAMKQIVNNCCAEKSFDVEELTLFDLEYLFLQLRAVSVNNMVSVSYRDNEDNEIYTFDIDLKEVNVLFPEGSDPIIKIDDKTGIIMRYPTTKILDDKEYFNTGDQAYFELILRCMDKIYDGDEVYECKNVSLKDREEFLDHLDITVFDKIQKFMNAAPRLYHKLEYVNRHGNKRVIELTSIVDFFTLR